jgi:hypothetical protein
VTYLRGTAPPLSHGGHVRAAGAALPPMADAASAGPDRFDDATSNTGYVSEWPQWAFGLLLA